MSVPIKSFFPLPKALADSPIKRIMTENVAVVSSTTTIDLAMQIILNKEVSSAPVVDGAQKCIGILTEKDLMLQAATHKKSDKIKFSEDLDFLRGDDKFKDVLVKLYNTHRKSFPVLDAHRHVIGIVSRRDILKTLFIQTEKSNG